MFSIKKEYIIEPSKIRQTYDFWQTVKNKVMEEIALDEEVLSNLPENEVSTEIFFVKKINMRHVAAIIMMKQEALHY